MRFLPNFENPLINKDFTKKCEVYIIVFKKRPMFNLHYLSEYISCKSKDTIIEPQDPIQKKV